MSSKTNDKIEADPVGVEKSINTLKSSGCFDQFRKEFLADVDTKVFCVISFRDFNFYLQVLNLPSTPNTS